MRTWLLVKVVIVGLIVGCAGVEDKHRAYFHDDSKYPSGFSASHLGQDFDERGVVDLLSPEERRAMAKTDWSWGSRERDVANDFDPSGAELGAEPSSSDKFAGATMSVLGMAITLGAMAAPFFLY